MKFLRDLVENGRKLYHAPGSKFHKFWPAFDANETFLFVPGETTPKKGPQVRDYADLKRTMTAVIIALIPCLLWSFFNTGYQHFEALSSMATEGGYVSGWLQSLVFGGAYAPNLAEPAMMDILVFGLQRMVPLLIVSYGVGLGIEVLFAIVRQEEVSEGFLVSGMLIALIVPPSVPLWQLAVAVAFSVILAKEVFGGTGMNIFNPAMMVRAFLFFAFPGQISGDAVWVSGNGAYGLIDGFTGATPLAAAAAAKLSGNHLPTEDIATVTDAVAAMPSWADMFYGFIPGSAGETSTLCILIGAAFLIISGVGSWRTMLAGVIGLFVMTFIVQQAWGLDDGLCGLPAHYHLVAGGFAFGLVFMATDPVTCPETNTGKWVYGFLIGAVTILVRAVNPAYPEGMMLAILLMNAFAPTIDHFVVQANIRRRKVRLG